MIARDYRAADVSPVSRLVFVSTRHAGKRQVDALSVAWGFLLGVSLTAALCLAALWWPL